MTPSASHSGSAEGAGHDLPGSAPAEAPSPAARAQRGKARAAATRDRLVLLSMTAVAAAVAAMASVQFEISAAGSTIAGFAVLAVSLTLHAQAQKSSEITRLKSEIARMEHDRHPVATAGDTTPVRHVAAPRPAADPRPAGTIDGAPLVIEPNARWEQPAQPAPQLPAGQRATGVSPPSGTRPPKIQSDASGAPNTLSQAQSQAQSASLIDAALWPGTSLVTSDPMRDQWAFRPREAGSGPAAGPTANPVQRSGPVPPFSTVDADLAIVQRKIKALADEVNAAETTKPRSASAGTSRVAPQSALDHSIDALKSAAGTMRDRPAPPPTVSAMRPGLFGDLPIPSTAERIAVSEPVAPPPFLAPPLAALTEAIARETRDEAVAPAPGAGLAAVAQMQPLRLAAIMSAIEADRLEVRLSPIVGLATHEVSHYDLSFHLKTQSGDVLGTPEHDLMLAGGDLLAVFDTARLLRASALAARLDARRKGGALLSPVSGPSITNASFLETFARIYEDRESVARQLVLTFSQADTEQFSASAWQALSDMNAFGFHFALDGIDHLSTDFALLEQRGFRYVKLGAAALLNGVPSHDGFIPAEELCRHLAGAGLTLVAGQIDDEAVRARVFGFGVSLGQGQLFGGVRHVNVDPQTAGRSAAA